MDPDSIYDQVHARYSASALSATSPNHAKAIAQAFGYSAEELCSIPTASNLGLSCGNPLAIASLQDGETVIDLGCGAGFDVFLAAKRVTSRGKVIGVDINQDMLSKAHHNASKSQTTNISFIHSNITSIPSLPPLIADVIISNCVINLVPAAEKPLVFQEMYRLLKPGGRVAVSDILVRKELSGELRRNMAAYVGCVAGAGTKEEYEGWLGEAGFRDVLVVDAGCDLNLYTRGENEEGACCEEEGSYDADAATKDEGLSCCGSTQSCDGGVAEDMRRDLRDIDLNEWAGSFKIFAVKG
ncbi:arsenite methyltransferase [Plenodomus tracheiphilus IPT5]|uniref:Arsenite methyltransferase n=1 Tax=Plenodomus tracheiphilus IPT5 TaxID=1408161 RepID=A0A6A7AZ64_9PLEO|nr:arsenite methyltransferase [Plenodomus tracheiphilus IPT5]